MTAPRVAVVGGGLAGLAAAARLRQLGAEPTLFERADEVGGVVRTTRRDGWMIDRGPCLAAEPPAAVREMLDAAGASACTVRALPAANTRFMVHGGKPVKLPQTTSEFTASPLLTVAGRLRLLKERFIPAQRDATDESVDAFARRRFGDEMADRMFDPLVNSTSAGDPRALVARYAFPALVGHERQAGSGLQGSVRERIEARRRARGRPTGSWSCAEGMQQLARTLAEWIGGVRPGAAVDAVRVSGSGVNVTAGGISAGFDAAILAVPPPALAMIAVDAPGSSRLAEVAAMPMASIVSVSLGFRRDQVAHPLDGSRLLVPAVERRDILAAVFPSSDFEQRTPAGYVLITAYLGGVRRPDLVSLDPAAQAGLAGRELGSLLGISGAPVMTEVTVWRDALPQAVAGHGERLAVADAVEAAAPMLAFAGAWHDGLSVGEVLLGGMRAAERLAGRAGWGPG